MSVETRCNVILNSRPLWVCDSIPLLILRRSMIRQKLTLPKPLENGFLKELLLLGDVAMVVVRCCGQKIGLCSGEIMQDWWFAFSFCRENSSRLGGKVGAINITASYVCLRKDISLHLPSSPSPSLYLRYLEVHAPDQTPPMHLKSLLPSRTK